MLEKVYNSLLSLTFPQECLVCGKIVESFADGFACSACWKQTRLFNENQAICDKCGKLHTETPPKNKTFCRRCDKDFYDRARASGIYEYGLSATILKLKREPYIAQLPKKIFADSLKKTSFSNLTRIIPVPLAKERVIERGFNQAGILAKIVSKETGIVLDEASLVRTKHSRVRRAGMDRRGRELSVEKSFEVKRKRLIANQHVLLIDDVFASGATVSACAKTLKKNGANKVFVFTLARAN